MTCSLKEGGQLTDKTSPFHLLTVAILSTADMVVPGV